MSLRFLITTIAPLTPPPAPRVANDSFGTPEVANESFATSGRASAPHPDTPEGTPR
jgi:hypothetical protein